MRILAVIVILMSMCSASQSKDDFISYTCVDVTRSNELILHKYVFHTSVDSIDLPLKAALSRMARILAKIDSKLPALSDEQCRSLYNVDPASLIAVKTIEVDATDKDYLDRAFLAMQNNYDYISEWDVLSCEVNWANSCLKYKDIEVVSDKWQVCRLMYGVDHKSGWMWGYTYKPLLWPDGRIKGYHWRYYAKGNGEFANNLGARITIGWPGLTIIDRRAPDDARRLLGCTYDLSERGEESGREPPHTTPGVPLPH